MISGLYETHLFVANLENSIDFYKNTLGLELCHVEKERRIAFFWIGKPKDAMLGLWEKPASEICKSHIAFRCEADDILHRAADYFQQRKIKPYNFLQDGTERPMVFCWMPALSIYFNDPDGHSLEFIAILKGEGRPGLGVIPYDEWTRLAGNPGLDW